MSFRIRIKNPPRKMHIDPNGLCIIQKGLERQFQRNVGFHYIILITESICGVLLICCIAFDDENAYKTHFTLVNSPQG